MSRSIKYLLLLAAFVVILAGCIFAYNKLSADYVPAAAPADNDTVSSELGSNDSGETEGAQMAADFTVLSTNGQMVSLSDFFGKPIVVNFWASWCGPCTGELPAFEKLYGEYGDEIEFMMVNLTDGARETQNSAMRFLVNSDYTFPVYLDTEMEAATAYGIYFIPQTYLINEKGEIVQAHYEAITEEKLRDGIESQLLGE